jgi:hypothetical protein
MKRGLVVSDIHAGSIYGMLPPDFMLYDESTKSLNPGQQYLWSCWDHFCEQAGKFRPDFIIANGDLIDGPQRKNHQSEIALISPRDQGKAAAEVLSLLRQRVPRHTRWYFTAGTPYHVGDWGESEESIAEEFGGQLYSSVGTGRRCKEVLWLDVEGVIIEAAHHIGVTQGFYRATQLDKEMQWNAMTGKDPSKGVPRADLIVRSHVHYFNEVGHASKQGFTNPCWQLQTRFMRKNSVGRMLPDIGGVFLEIDGAAKLDGRRPVTIIPEIYRLPPLEVSKLEELNAEAGTAE